jgi:hypothetical protein
MYKIYWKGSKNSGSGSPMNYEAAKHLADFLNKKHPEITHWVESVV